MSRKVLIQIKRGQEKDISNLAVGELGYCEDTQKLYIGTKSGNVLLVAAQSVGDMLKTIYDTNNDGKIDMAEMADKVPWNGVTGKPNTFVPSSHIHSVGEVKGFPTMISSFQNDKNYVTKEQLGNAGYGDMMKSTYDKDNDGVIDKAKNAETLNGKSSDDIINSIQIGGRNLLLKTTETKGSSTGITGCQWSFKDIQFLRGKTIAISMDFHCVNLVKVIQERVGCEAQINFEDGTNSWIGVWHFIQNGTTFKGRKTSVVTIPDKPIKYISNMNLYGHFCKGDKVLIEFPKVEVGNKPTDWSPAPEDFIIKDALTWNDLKGV